MKQQIVFIFILGLFSCNQKVISPSSIEGRCYESAIGHLFLGNQICLYPGNKFRYIGHGPAIFVSKGNWEYNEVNNTIELISISDRTGNLKQRVDTMWVDLTGKEIKILNRKKLSFEGEVYRLK